MMKHTVMPEFITRQDIEPRTWSVQEGAPVRGDAWTEMRTAQMRVPMGDDELSRVVRAHELTHAKVSPLSKDALKSFRYDYDTLISAEEFRVNMLVKHLGFDIDALRDGSEPLAGEICGKNGNWNGMVRFIASTGGSKGAKDFIKGLRKTNPVFAEKAKQIHSALMKLNKQLFKDYGASTIASTQPVGDVPAGFYYYTQKVAEFLDNLLLNEQGQPGDQQNPGSPDGEDEELPNVSEVARGETGKWGKLVEKHVPKPRRVDGRLGRKRIATNIGKNPRRINRMLVDPEMRIFDRRAKGKGGVVLIDQSGSMRLEDDDIWNIIESAPGCTIIGYSHQTGNTLNVPNVWVIAENGKVAESIPSGNGGNGVDGPALRFALNKRRKGEPFVWVCDGEVTDGKYDQYYGNLGRECARLVHKHDIHMVEDMNEAITAFKRVATGGHLNRRFIGSVWRTARFMGLA